MIPYPVAFGILLQQWNEELQVFFDEECYLSLGHCQAISFSGCRISLFNRFCSLRSELFGEHILEYDASVVPYRVVFGILREEFRGELEGGVGVVAGFDLYASVNMPFRCIYTWSWTLPFRSPPSRAAYIGRSACAPLRGPVRSCRVMRQTRGELRAGREVSPLSF